MTSIPWGNEMGQTQTKILGELKDLNAAFERHTLCTIARNAIAEEVLSWTPLYHKGGSPDFKRSVPVNIPTLVRQIIAAVLQTGYFAYRFDAATKEMPLSLVIAHPLQTYPSRKKGGGVEALANLRYQEDPGSQPLVWDAVFFSEPTFFVHDGYSVCSKLREALPALELLREYNENFAQRDQRNSMHVGYANVNPALATINNGHATWFLGRDATTDAAIETRLNTDSDFNQIVKNRANTIRLLSDETAMTRAMSARDSMTAGEEPPPAKDHTEHIVTDGYSFTEADNLKSMGNAAHQHDRLEMAALFSLGVPPQALGRNINSERIAASNTLTQSAVRMFETYCARFRKVINTIMASASALDGSEIRFDHVLKEGQVDDLLPFLKTAHAKTLIATAHSIPVEWIDAERVSETQSVGPDGPAAGKKRKSGQDVSPERSAAEGLSLSKRARREKDRSKK